MSLSAPLSCTRCGYQNQPGYQFCSNCGAPLMSAPVVPAPAPAAPAGYPQAYPMAPGYGYYPPTYEYDRAKQIDRTKTGVLLLLIGTLLSWIPFGISIIGFILLFVGVILVILGRKAFGATHSRNVIISIVLFIVGVVVVGVVFFIAVITSLPSFVGPGGVSNPAALAAGLNATLIAAVAAAAVIGIAEILFTYALQVQTGRILLWAAYGANIALSIAVYAVIAPLLGGVTTTAGYDVVQAQTSTLQLLGVIPVALFAAADYLAWSRVSRGEIPGQAGGPSRPTAMAPPAAVPPATPPQVPPPSGPAPPMNPP